MTFKEFRGRIKIAIKNSIYPYNIHKEMLDGEKLTNIMPKILPIDRAKELLSRIPDSVCLKGIDRIKDLIKLSGYVEQQRDHISSIILATLLSDCATKLVFEESSNGQCYSKDRFYIRLPRKSAIVT